MNIALIIGGSIVIPHLRYAFEMLDELQSAEGGGHSAEGLGQTAWGRVHGE